MIIIIFSTLMSFIIVRSLLPSIIKLANANKIFDLPDYRKVHLIPVPSLGGVAIFAGMFISISLIAPFIDQKPMNGFMSAAIIIFFIGLLDDFFIISPLLKLSGQLIASFMIINVGHFQLTSFYGFLGFTDLNLTFSLFFSYLTILTIVNAFNLIDGIDGLAATIGIISTLFFGLFFVIQKDYTFSILSFSMTASLLAFLKYNNTPARIFMGDSGALLVGFVNAVLVIRFINTTSIPTALFKFSAAPAIGFAVLFFPLMDTFRVFFKRIYSGRSPFDSDVNHLHHLMLGKGFSHKQISGILGILTIFFILFSILFQPLGINFIISGLVICGMSFVVYFESISPIVKKADKVETTLVDRTKNQPEILIKKINKTREFSN